MHAPFPYSRSLFTYITGTETGKICLRKLVLSGNRIGGTVACARGLRDVIAQNRCCLEVRIPYNVPSGQVVSTWFATIFVQAVVSIRNQAAAGVVCREGWLPLHCTRFSSAPNPARTLCGPTNELLNRRWPSTAAVHINWDFFIRFIRMRFLNSSYLCLCALKGFGSFPLQHHGQRHVGIVRGAR